MTSASRASQRGRHGRGWFAAVLTFALGAALIVGCEAGPPTTVGTHRFGISSDYPMPVEDPPTTGSFLGSSTAGIGTAQFSPDGAWLYVTWADCGSCTLASRSLDRSTPGVLAVTVGTQSHCYLSCAANARLGATRFALDPPIDPANPPSVVSASSGEPVPVEPWLP
jgi:hypothetical protein